LGEGAAFFVLERAEDAERRGATIWGEIVGIGVSQDLEYVLGNGFEPEAVEAALADAGLTLADCAFVVAHGIGTLEGDRREAAALRRLGAGDKPVTALKGHTGYLGAASAAVELALGLLCTRAGFVPPIAHLEQPDLGIGLDLVRQQGRPLSGSRSMGLYLSGSWGGQVTAIGARPT
jgi:3-oxoacyl-[acyl-carrier-protein] synthase II